MSQQNVETIRGLYDSFSKGDIPTVLAGLDADIAWTEAEGFPYAGTYHGPESVLENVFARLGSEWDGFHAEPEEFVDGGETVVALGTYSGAFKETGKSFRAAFAHVWDLRDGKVVRFRQYTDTAKVREAL